MKKTDIEFVSCCFLKGNYVKLFFCFFFTLPNIKTTRRSRRCFISGGERRYSGALITEALISPLKQRRCFLLKSGSLPQRPGDATAGGGSGRGKISATRRQEFWRFYLFCDSHPFKSQHSNTVEHHKRASLAPCSKPPTNTQQQGKKYRRSKMSLTYCESTAAWIFALFFWEGAPWLKSSRASCVS